MKRETLITRAGMVALKNKNGCNAIYSPAIAITENAINRF